MPFKPGTLSKTLTGAAAVLAAAAAIALVAFVVSGGSSRPGENPYAYDLPAMDPSRNVAAAFRETGSFNPGFEKIAGLAVGEDDELFVVGDASLSIFDSAGGKKASFLLPESPTCVAVLRRSFFSGTPVPEEAPVFVGLADRVICLGPGGDLLSEGASLGERARITSLAAGPSELFAADAGNRLVWRFDHSGAMTSVLGRQGDGFVVPSPFFDAALDPEGHLWVANPGERRLEKYDASLVKTAQWGKSSMDLEGFCGCCNPSHFALDGQGRFYTAEKGLPRIKQYDRRGAFLSLVAGSDRFDEGTVGLDLAVDSKGRVLAADPKRGLIRLFSPN